MFKAEADISQGKADATGTVAIGAALVFLVLVGAGRWWRLW